MCVQADLLDWMVFSLDPHLLAYKRDDLSSTPESRLRLGTCTQLKVIAGFFLGWNVG